MHLDHVRRLGAVLGAVTLGASLIVMAPSAAHAAPDDRSAGWLTRQLDGGLVHNDQFDFDDYGLTADTAIALAAIGGEGRTVRRISRALADNVRSWTTGVDFESSDIYAGSTAKAVVLAQTAGRTPRSFGGVNLVRQLGRLVSTRGNTRGRIQDRAETDYANVLGQSFAVQGLSRAGSGKADTALAFLLRQQCSRGYFRLNFAPATSARQSCDAGTRLTSAPDTDATALAILSMETIRKPGRTVRAAIADGVRWLKRRQAANGSFGGGTSTRGKNTNSTGLAAWALGEAGACGTATKAAAWVKRFQVQPDESAALAGEKGAIAYNRAALRSADANGIGVAERDQFRRATSQAAPGLSYLAASACRR